MTSQDGRDCTHEFSAIAKKWIDERDVYCLITKNLWDLKKELKETPTICHVYNLFRLTLKKSLSALHCELENKYTMHLYMTKTCEIDDICTFYIKKSKRRS